MTSSAVKNAILSSIPPRELGLVLPHLERLDMAAGTVLERPGQPARHVHFLESGLASTVVRLQDPVVIETGQVGFDGYCGIGAVLGCPVPGHMTVMRIGGAVLRADAERIRGLARQSPSLRRALLGFVQVAQRHMAQTVYCTARHKLPERLASQLLLLSRMLDSDELPITHVMLATMLGVRRAGVTTIMRRFERMHLIHQRWGSVYLRDPPALREEACGCNLPAAMAGVPPRSPFLPQPSGASGLLVGDRGQAVGVEQH